MSPEAAAGGVIGLVRKGDRIHIDIPSRTINAMVSDKELTHRLQLMNDRHNHTGWKSEHIRPRKVSTAWKAHSLMATSADKSVVRNLENLE